MSQYEQDVGFRAEYNKLWDASIGYKRPAASASEVNDLLLKQHDLHEIEYEALLHDLMKS